MVVRGMYRWASRTKRSTRVMKSEAEKCVPYDSLVPSEMMSMAGSKSESWRTNRSEVYCE